MKKLTLLVPFLAIAIASAQEESCKPLPKFKLQATNGKSYGTKEFGDKPTVVIFLKKGCPHNPHSAPDFNLLAKQLGPKVNVVAVVDADLKTAKGYAKELKLSIPLIADGKKSLIGAFGAKRSLDMAITCAHDKKIAQFWEGYNRETLEQLVASLPAHGGPSVKLNAKQFPEKKQSGCPFGM